MIVSVKILIMPDIISQDYIRISKYIYYYVLLLKVEILQTERSIDKCICMCMLIGLKIFQDESKFCTVKLEARGEPNIHNNILWHN